MCESRNILIHLGDGAGTSEKRPVQCFQLISLFSVNEEGQKQIPIAFKLGIIAIFGGCQIYSCEYPER